MRQLLIRCGVVCVGLLFFAPPLWAYDNIEIFQGQDVAAREVLVKFRAARPETLNEVEQAGDVDVSEGVGGAGAHLFRSRSKDVATLVRDLSAHPDVAFAEPNFIVHAIALSNDPFFGDLWGLQNTGQTIGTPGTRGADIDAVLAWDISTGSRGHVVTVVDTGIDYTHPDLAANVWSAPTAFTVTIGGRSITCAAGTHGFNAITNTCNPRDDDDHGSHVSGTIGAVGNNALGVVGVNWTASIMGSKFLDASGSGTTAGAINAIEFAIQAKAAFAATRAANVRVLSNSWGGGGFSQALLDQINRANANDMLFVAAAGNAGKNNDTKPFYPASYNAPNVVTVAATDNLDALAWFSNYGRTSVHLGAPGVDVRSTIIGGGYAYGSGTSMATPHVSGAGALVLSTCPLLNTAGLKATILTNVDLISSLVDRTVTGGRLNVNKAIRACSAPATPDFSLSASPTSRTVVRGAGTTYTVTVTPSGGFTGTVTFSASGLPAGATLSFTPPSVTTSGNSTGTVTTSSTTLAGTYPFTITGTSGSVSRPTSVTLVVQAPNFSLSASPTSRTVVRGAGTTYTVTVTPSGGFTGTVTFSASGLPAGATLSFTPPSVTTSGNSTGTVTTSSTTTPAGTYPFTITGTSGSLTRTATATLVVQQSSSPPPPCNNGQCNN
jgi:subtilisin family serine protease